MTIMGNEPRGRVIWRSEYIGSEYSILSIDRRNQVMVNAPKFQTYRIHIGELDQYVRSDSLEEVKDFIGMLTYHDWLGLY